MSGFEHRSSAPLWRLAAGATVGLLAVFLAAGCSDSTSPGPQVQTDPPAETFHEGSFDPGSGTFELQVLQQPDDPPEQLGNPVSLVGRDLEIDPDTETVSLQVAIHNGANRPLYAPAVVWLFDLNPASVEVLNPDLVQVPYDALPRLEGPLQEPRYGFDFSEQFGEDGILAGGESSEFKTWSFRVPGLVPFTFAARVQLGQYAPGARIAGTTYHDPNENGQHDPDEAFLVSGIVLLEGPDGVALRARPDSQGSFSFSVRTAGLYRLTYIAERTPGREPVFTTPNPLQVVLPPGPDGTPVDFLDAHFGVFFRGGPDPAAPIVLTDLPLEDLLGFEYRLLDLNLRGNILRAKVGFSGCQPDHPFTLYMYGGFMESLPVQANLMLTHEIEEDCDAYFEREYLFNLDPLGRAYLEAYGEPGILILNVRDHAGEVRRIRLQI